jgi:hypothetical protein
MILILKIIYCLIGLWVAFNAAFKGGIPFTDTVINDKYLSILSVIFSGIFWIFLPLIPSIKYILDSFKN